MDLEEVVCSCFGVTTGMIKTAVEDGATTLEEVQSMMDVGTACGACIDEVQRVIDNFASEVDYESYRNGSRIVTPVDPLPESFRERRDGPGGDEGK